MKRMFSIEAIGNAVIGNPDGSLTTIRCYELWPWDGPDGLVTVHVPVSVLGPVEFPLEHKVIIEVPEGQPASVLPSYVVIEG